jgi:hypothetical protein
VAVDCVVDGVAVVVVVVVVEVACGFNALVRLQGFFVKLCSRVSRGTVG